MGLGGTRWRQAAEGSDGCRRPFPPGSASLRSGSARLSASGSGSPIWRPCCSVWPGFYGVPLDFGYGRPRWSRWARTRQADGSRTRSAAGLEGARSPPLSLERGLVRESEKSPKPRLASGGDTLPSLKSPSWVGLSMWVGCAPSNRRLPGETSGLASRPPEPSVTCDPASRVCLAVSRRRVSPRVGAYGVCCVEVTPAVVDSDGRVALESRTIAIAFRPETTL